MESLAQRIAQMRLEFQVIISIRILLGRFLSILVEGIDK